MYYIAVLRNDGTEEVCDFGFDMLERIILDECFRDLKKPPKDLVKEKRFCLYEKNFPFDRQEILGAHVVRICNRYGIYLGPDTCFATVLDKASLKIALERMWMKVFNARQWRCKNVPQRFGLFDAVVVYDPYIMRTMLSERKYGVWNHNNDRENALQVLAKFIGFLRDYPDFDALILYNEIFCSRWESTGELYVNPYGRVTGYRYFGERKAFTYVYNPKVDIWQRV